MGNTGLRRGCFSASLEKEETEKKLISVTIKCFDIKNSIKIKSEFVCWFI
jgi:hypothetical protein